MQMADTVAIFVQYARDLDPGDKGVAGIKRQPDVVMGVRQKPLQLVIVLHQHHQMMVIGQLEAIVAQQQVGKGIQLVAIRRQLTRLNGGESEIGSSSGVSRQLPAFAVNHHLRTELPEELGVLPHRLQLSFHAAVGQQAAVPAGRRAQVSRRQQRARVAARRGNFRPNSMP